MKEDGVSLYIKNLSLPNLFFLAFSSSIHPSPFTTKKKRKENELKSTRLRLPSCLPWPKATFEKPTNVGYVASLHRSNSSNYKIFFSKTHILTANSLSFPPSTLYASEKWCAII
jgi:hypothetical protein